MQIKDSESDSDQMQQRTNDEFKGSLSIPGIEGLHVLPTNCKQPKLRLTSCQSVKERI